jgi:hypothetical protein
VEDHRIKATPGITGWWCPRVHIDDTVRHLDVGSSHPGGGENISSLPIGNNGVINKLKTAKAFVDFLYQIVQFAHPRYNIFMKVNTVGKRFFEVERAYLAGLLDADGAIMATIERHSEKKFRYRVRVTIQITQHDRKILDWIVRNLKCGYVHKNRTTFDWLIRNQRTAKEVLILLLPYLKVKNNQAKIVIKILNGKIDKFADLLKRARLADSLSRLNVRSKNRRKNFVTMIQENLSSND